MFTWLAVSGCSCAALAALGASPAVQAPLRAWTEQPATLDLRGDAPADWIPLDTRNPALVQEKNEAWSRRVATLQNPASVRILLPRGPGRIPLLLAASQALRAHNPAVTLYLAFDVDDPIYVQDNTGYDTWKGDCVQLEFNLDPAKSASSTGNDLEDARSFRVSEIDLALTKNGPEA